MTTSSANRKRRHGLPFWYRHSPTWPLILLAFMVACSSLMLGCTSQFNPDKAHTIAGEIAKCEQAGLRAEVIFNSLNESVKIRCVPGQDRVKVYE